MNKKDNFKTEAYSKLLIKIYKREPEDLIPLTSNRVKLIENEIATLDSNSIEILNLHWGLKDGKPIVLREIGAKFGVSPERIRQIEIKAFRKLNNKMKGKIRLSKYIFFFSDLFYRIDNLEELISENKELKRRLNLVEDLLPISAKQRLREYNIKYLYTDKDHRLTLEKPVSFFEFSVRIHNCLANEGIETIRDLLCYTEAELMLVRNLGRHSIRMIKEILAQHFLQLGMFFPK